MAAAADVGLVGILSLGYRAGRLADRFGKRHQIVVARRGRAELAVVAHQVPAAGRREAAGMGLAEVIGVRLGKRGQRTDDRSRLRVDIRQRRDGVSGTSVARASPWGPHGGTVSLHRPNPRFVAARHAV